MQWEGEDDLKSSGWLRQEQFVRLGRYRVRWKSQLRSWPQDDEPFDPLASEPIIRPGADPLPGASLELPIRIGESTSRWTLNACVTMFGRADECHLVLTDDSISRYHVSLVRTPLGVWAVDLLSREGVWVNGLRVKWAWLDEGDALRIGRFTFVVRYGRVPDRVRRIDIPLEAGAYCSPPPAVSARGTDMLPVKVTRPLPARSSYPARAKISYPAHPHVEAPPLSVSPDDDEWGRLAEFSAGPTAMWHQHRQFLEMFHSEMLLMVQMFMTMHRDHVGVIREELARIEELTGELANLQTQLGPRSSPGKRNQPVDDGHRSSEPVVRLPVARAKLYRDPGPPPPTRNNGRQQRKPAQAVGKSRLENSRASSASGADKHDAAQTPPMDTVAFHAEITNRIAELQRERQGYWRKILNLMAVSAD
jgi:predicted component of type VI protein secretion system